MMKCLFARPEAASALQDGTPCLRASRHVTPRSSFWKIGWCAVLTLGVAPFVLAKQPATAPPSPPVSELPAPPANAPPSPSTSTPGAGERELPSTPSNPLGRVAEVLPIPLPAPRNNAAPPGEPSRRGRPRPGSFFNPGASGPGISRSGSESFLDGALDPQSGWPFVFLDHFVPRPDRVANLWVVDTRETSASHGVRPLVDLACPAFRLARESCPGRSRRAISADVRSPNLDSGARSLTTPDIALGGLLWSHAWLERDGGILPGTVMIAFDWPSQRIYRNDVRDINEKGPRTYIAGYHLARFVQAFPPESQICLLGQSYGGRVVPSALHLLGGGALNSQDHDEPVALPGVRSDLHLRGVILGGASDRNWLDPGERLDHTLLGCEAFLNLYNSRDEASGSIPCSSGAIIIMRSANSG